MARRLIAALPDAFPYETQLQKLERAVVYRTVRCDFTARDVMDALYPAHVLDILCAAHPYADCITSPLFTHILCDGVDLSLQVTCEKINMVKPDTDLIKAEWQLVPSTILVQQALQEVINIRQRFSIVERVMKWFNANKVTPGAARHYFPGCGVLLAPEHPFHRADGLRYRDIYPPSNIIAALREAPTVLTAALMADPDNLEERPAGMVRVSLEPGRQWLTLIT